MTPQELANKERIRKRIQDKMIRIIKTSTNLSQIRLAKLTLKLANIIPTENIPD